MERRSRSQVRRVENTALSVPPSHSRHASSTRIEQQQQRAPSSGRPAPTNSEDYHSPMGHQPSHNGGPLPSGHRTLSPDRKDRYRSSVRGGGGYGYVGDHQGPPPPGFHHPGSQPQQHSINSNGGGSLALHQPPHLPGSNSNSYNQYNQPHPMLQNGGLSPYSAGNNNNSVTSPQQQTAYGGGFSPTKPAASSSGGAWTEGSTPSGNYGPNQGVGHPGNYGQSPSNPNNSNGGYGGGDPHAPQVNSVQLAERIAWELHHVTLNRVAGYGFGIAVSGGRDNPHFSNGDTSIAISDVLKGGPAEGKLMINDRVISANNISLEGVDYATAVQVLRDSGQSVNLVVKRRVVLPAPPEPHNIRVTLIKNKKKDDFGIVLGCKIYIKEIGGRSLADRDGTLNVGDLLTKLNNLAVDGLSLKEAKKILDAAKDKLEITVQRDPYRNSALSKSDHSTNSYASPVRKETKNNNLQQDGFPPSRPPPPKDSVLADSSNVSEAGTLPLAEASRDVRTGDYSGNQRKSEESSPSKGKSNLPDPRFISFIKDGSVGIRLTGGNDSGIFVTAVQPGSPAAQQGLQPGDKIIKVNDMDMAGVTREEAVLYLLSLQDKIDLIAQYRKEEYEQIVQNQRGDSFYIKAHFNYEQTEKGEMSFKKCDVFHVVDTLHNGVVGSWQAFRMDPFLSGLGRAAEQVQKGVIPNKARAEEIATQQFNAAKKEQSVSEQNKGSFFKRKRLQNHRRSKSLGKDHWEDLVWSESMSKFPAYERVTLRHPGFPRPVVIFGPVADIARERLLRDFPLKFASPQQDSSGTGENKKSGIVRLSAIRDIMDKGLHALLDVTPNAVDKLNYAQFYPIVILAKADTKQTIKECRAGIPKKAHLSSKKLLEQSQKIEKLWGHILTTTLHLHPDNWYNKITDLIEKQQTAPIWMSESEPEGSFSDDFLFPMSSRLSLTLYPESDGDFCGEDTPRRSTGMPAGHDKKSGAHNQDSGRLYRANSDPNLRKDGTIQSKSGERMAGFGNSQQMEEGGAGNSDRYGTGGTKGGSNHAPVPPKIDRQKKPHKKSASERLFGLQGKNNSDETDGKMQETPAAARETGTGYNSLPPQHSDQQQHSNNNNYKLASNPNSYDPQVHGPYESHVGKRPNGMDADGGQYSRGSQLANGNNANNNNNSNLPMGSSSNGSYGGYALPPGQQPGSTGSVGSQQQGGTGYNVYNGQQHNNQQGGQENYRYSDYKPMPPPKSSVYKPIPPPKPKPFSSSNSTSSNGSHQHQQMGGGSRASSQPPAASAAESNYMNGNYLLNSTGNHQSSGAPGEGHPQQQPQPEYGGANSYHYHSSRVVNTGVTDYSAGGGASRHPANRSNNNNNNNYPADDLDSNGGVDSGQGSSLDRDYSNYNGKYGSGPPPVGGPPHPGSMMGGGGGQRPPSSVHNPGQFYYNVPPGGGGRGGGNGGPVDQQQPPSHAHNGGTVEMGGVSPRRRAPGDTLDLTNREYRGSAFELYKKPGFQPFPSYGEIQR